MIIFTGNPTPVQQTLSALDDKCRRRECDSQEENNSRYNKATLIIQVDKKIKFKNTHVKITPGATKSVKLGSLLPYIGSLNCKM
jgi:hypothetical protein